MQVGLGELVGQQAEDRDIARPAPARGLQRQHGRLQGIARLGAVDKNRPGHWIDEGKIELL